jgi:hypothetical protein
MLGRSRKRRVVPISTAMHRPDHFDDGPDPGELPDLPIPRPGEGPAERAPAPKHPPLSQPRLGGGASFTSVGEDDPPVSPPQPERTPLPDDGVELISVDRACLESERFTWELAATLTAGMLANPERYHASVKDAMAMFDQFLQEMHSYSRIASEFDITGDREQRRREHTEYFQGGQQPNGEVAPQPQQQGQQQPSGQQVQGVPIKQLPPQQPRPGAGYTPLPPGARPGLYVPGSMAGAPPDPSGDEEADVA